MKSPVRGSSMLAAALIILTGVQPGSGLTIFHIGDTSDAICSDPDARCFDWFEVTDVSNLGLAQGVEAPQGFLQPEALDINDNIAPIVREREHGWLKSSNGYGWQDEGRSDGRGLDWIIDNDVTTAYTGVPRTDGNPSCKNPGFQLAGQGGQRGGCKGIWFKLGGLFPIDRVVLHTTPEGKNERFIPDFVIGTNDADVERALTDMTNNANLRERDGYIEWRGNVFVDFDIVHYVQENTLDSLVLTMPDEPISEIVFGAPYGSWEIAEFHIYGEGFTTEASYVTELIELDDFSSLGDLTWSGEVPAGSRVNLSMRTGDDLTPDIYWRWDHERGGARTRLDTEGAPLSRSFYNDGDKLSGTEQAGVTPDKDNWEFWSPPVNFNDFRVSLVGKKPRKFVQLRADFFSDNGEAGGRIDFLEFRVSSPPLASQVLAEIVPLAAPLGVTTKFTYKVNPTIVDGTDLGFDSIQIFTPLAPESVDSLRFIDPVNGLTELGPGEFTLIDYADDNESFTVQLQEGMQFRDQEVIDVVFQAAVFKVGTVFNGKVFNSQRPGEIRQRVTVGDADPLFDSSSLSVIPSDVGGQVITALRASPLTPNGDDTNETLNIEYDLVNLDGDVPITLSVFTLAGDVVAEIPVTSLGSGRFPATWNGVGTGGDLVPPGLYVLRLKVESDKETVTALTTFPVVY